LTHETILLVPCFNPLKNWEVQFYERYQEFISIAGKQIPVVLINDGSSQSLEQEVAWLQNRIKENFYYLELTSNLGKGGALKAGAGYIDSEYYIFTDIDFPYTAKSMAELLSLLLSEKGLIPGNREKEYYQDMNTFRSIISRLLRSLNYRLLKLPVNDTQCGLKGFDKNAREILLQCSTNRFLIDLEWLLAAHHAGIAIKPSKVQLREGLQLTSFNPAILGKEIFSFLKILWKYRVLHSKKN